MEIMKWRDGSEKICEICDEPIYTTQPIVGTITQVPKKRHCRHFLCLPNASITVIGNGQVTVFKKSRVILSYEELYRKQSGGCPRCPRPSLNSHQLV